MNSSTNLVTRALAATAACVTALGIGSAAAVAGTAPEPRFQSPGLSHHRCFAPAVTVRIGAARRTWKCQPGPRRTSLNNGQGRGGFAPLNGNGRGGRIVPLAGNPPGSS